MHRVSIIGATALGALVVAMPSAAAEPLFDIPVTALPYIVVPPAVYDGVVGLGYQLNAGILALDDGVVRGFAGAVGGIVCALAAGSASPCGSPP
ncbi:hypothetical protein [Skermania piniformis]|uniref:Uncharacterized protein n=1 Tax=Skermania pinensis TaxID=39122 RepID=A0ABX8S645_9ACTN|nr:hypothetical protein [Skermania piniformis]QXQ13308.1 hypothetical protein KV203_15760 [Skermania piniformis]